MAIKEKDMVVLNYTGRTKDEGKIFDTTELDVAKKNGLMNERTTDDSFDVATVSVGMGEILNGIDKSLVGKSKGKYTLELEAKDAFGIKSSKFVQLVPMSKFRKENIRPFPGMEVMVDDGYGIVRTVSGGRVVVDFNHPFASKDVIYEVNVLDIITDDLEKIKKISERPNLKGFVSKVEKKEKDIIIKVTKDIEATEKEMLANMFNEYISDKSIKVKVLFDAEKPAKKE